jgi:hypothetical protein
MSLTFGISINTKRGTKMCAYYPLVILAGAISSVYTGISYDLELFADLVTLGANWVKDYRP